MTRFMPEHPPASKNRAIAALVYDLYALTPAAIALVEGSPP